MDPAIFGLGVACCAYTAWELTRLWRAAARHPGVGPEPGARQAPAGPLRAQDARTGRPLQLRKDRRHQGRRASDAAQHPPRDREASWSAAC